MGGATEAMPTSSVSARNLPRSLGLSSLVILDWTLSVTTEITKVAIEPLTRERKMMSATSKMSSRMFLISGFEFTSLPFLLLNLFAFIVPHSLVHRPNPFLSSIKPMGYDTFRQSRARFSRTRCSLQPSMQTALYQLQEPSQ